MQSSDLNELKGLVAELRAEHVAQKEKEKRERWTKYVSLTMVVIAVTAAIATLKGGGFSTRTLKDMNEATFNQAQASDQWSYFEAKSIKQNLYDIELDHLNAAPSPDAAAIAKMKTKVDKYDKDKADITAQAKKFEEVRDAARKSATSAAEHSKQMGLSITLFQIAIALGAMCLIVKKKPLWFASMILGALALAQMIYVLYFLPL
jgi:phosphoribosylformylglycinamidine (FGAM) synthase-like enzyme